MKCAAIVKTEILTEFGHIETVPGEPTSVQEVPESSHANDHYGGEDHPAGSLAAGNSTECATGCAAGPDDR